MLPSTPKRPLPDLPEFSSPPPSSPGLPFSSPTNPHDLTFSPTPRAPGLWAPFNTTPQHHPLPMRLMELTPEPFMSPVSNNKMLQQQLQDSGKRGRPRADAINHLIIEGSSSPSEIKCKVCNRVFPREKSLQAHLRTHTGEKPYKCDYPGCNRAFTQSGQLKTHQRLHAGEKPFACSAPGCPNRYTHANRTCPSHPYSKPQRSTELVLQPALSAAENCEEVQAWLENYRRERQEKTPGKIDIVAADVKQVTPVKKPRSKRGLANELEQENVPVSFQPHPNIEVEQQPRDLSQIKAPLPFQQHPVSLSPRRQQQTVVVPVSPTREHRTIPLSPRRQVEPNIAMLLPKSPVRKQLSPLRHSSPLRRIPLSPLRPATARSSPLRSSPATQRYSSILEKRLILSSSPKRRLLPEENRSVSEVLKPKKKWLAQLPSVEVLAKPICWNAEEDESDRKRRDPGPAWTAATALIEMGEKPLDQPLNLSMSSVCKS